ncbi:MAG: hypothetical protein AAGF11_31190 [Myxococcota bacterium]
MNDSTTELDRLLSAARSLDAEPPAEAGARIWSGVAASAGTPGVAVSLGAASSSALKIGLVVAVTLVGGAIAWTVWGSSETGAESTDARVSAAPSEVPAEPRPEPAVLLVPEQEPVLIIEDDDAKRVSRPRSARAGAARTEADLAEETRLLRQAKVALGRGDAASAHAKLQRHAKRFARGELVEVRMALEVQVLCALDRPQQARRIRKRFLSRFPRSALTGQVKGGCTEP